MLGFFSSRRNWDSPHSLTRRRVSSPTLVPGGRGGTHSLGGDGVGVPMRTKGQRLWYSCICTLLARRNSALAKGGTHTEFVTERGNIETIFVF